jgi:hypothetical protein
VVAARVLGELAERFLDRLGGYTRVLKLGRRRPGDAAPVSIVELVEASAPAAKPAAGKRAGRKAAAKPAAEKAARAEEKAARAEKKAARAEKKAAARAAAKPAAGKRGARKAAAKPGGPKPRPGGGRKGSSRAKRSDG